MNNTALYDGTCSRGRAELFGSVSNQTLWAMALTFLLTLLAKLALAQGSYIAPLFAVASICTSVWWLWCMFMLARTLGGQRSEAVTMTLLMLIPLLNIILTISTVRKAKRVAATAQPQPEPVDVDG